MRENNLVGIFAAGAAVLALSSAAYAVPGDLEIKVDKNADLTREPTLTNLTTETRFAEEKEKHADQLSVSASFLNLGHPSITTDQTSTYNMSSGAAIGFEYSHSFGVMHLTGTIGYDYLQQSTAPAATALHVIPVGLMAEYFYKKFEKVRPFIGAGVMTVIESQRGIDEENLTQLNTLPLFTAGVDIKTPWDFKVHTRVRQLVPLASGASELNGQIFDVGVVYSM